MNISGSSDWGGKKFLTFSCCSCRVFTWHRQINYQIIQSIFLKSLHMGGLLTRAAIFMKSIFPPDRKPVSMKLGSLPPPLPPSSPKGPPAPAKPWAGNPKGNPGKPLVFCPGIGNPDMKLKGPPRLASPSSPRPESREAVPLAG